MRAHVRRGKLPQLAQDATLEEVHLRHPPVVIVEALQERRVVRKGTCVRGQRAPELSRYVLHKAVGSRRSAFTGFADVVRDDKIVCRDGSVPLAHDLREERRLATARQPHDDHDGLGAGRSAPLEDTAEDLTSPDEMLAALLHPVTKAGVQRGFRPRADKHGSVRELEGNPRSPVPFFDADARLVHVLQLPVVGDGHSGAVITVNRRPGVLHRGARVSERLFVGRGTEGSAAVTALVLEMLEISAAEHGGRLVRKLRLPAHNHWHMRLLLNALAEVFGAAAVEEDQLQAALT
mmetsp:Transcript_20752/g.61362  ORF Transcript_20752/g.61362 Transcript_20752/m.61362 type:complete len:292 (-) Transcript_20752:136-1011(-)